MTISRRRLISTGAAAAAGLALGRLGLRAQAAPVPSAGPFLPTWESLAQYQAPDWFRDAKFGIWAHWGPQCQPGQGDWYGRQMYQEGSGDYNYQCAHYGHPSKAGSAGEAFTVAAGGQSVAGMAVSTGGWKTFADQPLATLTLAEAGKQTLSFKPGAGWKGIALRSITLTKVP